ncbi:MAG TPA: hypothetical protein VLO07_06410 [Thermoanaerobaculia bacterium]|nr:hypothetical protein [Thermoanaerobaculia bacterium]
MTFPAVWRREGKSAVVGIRRCFLLAAALQAARPAVTDAATYSVAGFSDTAIALGLAQPTGFTWTGECSRSDPADQLRNCNSDQALSRDEGPGAGLIVCV